MSLLYTGQNFCKWQAHRNQYEESGPVYYDVALLLTRYRLTGQLDSSSHGKLTDRCTSPYQVESQGSCTTPHYRQNHRTAVLPH